MNDNRGVNELESIKISIITICYNAETLIKGTMNSVLCQSYKEIEYIIIDGKSNDNTIKSIDEIKEKYPYREITVISEPDQGISDAMNKGTLLASGEIVTHLHAGDTYINDSVIEKVMKSYSDKKWRWAVAGSIVIDQFGTERHIYKARTDDVNVLLKKNCIPHQSTFLVKDIFKKNGLFRVDFKQAMDYEFWLRIAFQGNERFTILPFNTTYFLDGGRSANIYELLKYLYKIRKQIHAYGYKSNFIVDGIFLARVYLFHWYYQAKKVIGGK